MRNLHKSALLLYAFMLFFSSFAEGIVVAEWIISFSPFLVVLSIIIVIGSLVFQKSQKKHTTDILFLIGIIFVGIATLVMAKNVTDFAYVKPTTGTGTNAITLAFFNKFYENSNYPSINEAIKRVDPDIIGFAEITKEDLTKLHVSRQYPYSFIKITDDGYTLGLFSKHPIKQLSLKGFSGSRMIALESMWNGSFYTIIVVHFSSPVRPIDLAARNKELNALRHYIKQINSQPLLLMGDFNLTPWSKTYDALENNLPSLKNIAKGQGLNFTWGIYLPIVQIDHIFVPKNAVVESFSTESVKGSDHRLIWGKIKL